MPENHIPPGAPLTDVPGGTPTDTETADKLLNTQAITPQAVENPYTDPLQNKPRPCPVPPDLPADILGQIIDYLPTKDVLKMRQVSTSTNKVIENYLQRIQQERIRIVDPKNGISAVPPNTQLKDIVDGLRQHKMIRLLATFDPTATIEAWDAVIRAANRRLIQAGFKVGGIDIMIMSKVQSCLTAAPPEEATSLRQELYIYIGYCVEKGLLRVIGVRAGTELKKDEPDLGKILASWAAGDLIYDSKAGTKP